MEYIGDILQKQEIWREQELRDRQEGEGEPLLSDEDQDMEDLQPVQSQDGGGTKKPAKPEIGGKVVEKAAEESDSDDDGIIERLKVGN